MIDFFEFSNEMLCLADHRGYFTRVNQAWTTTLGWSADELTSRPYIDFVHPDDLESTIEEARLLLGGSHESILFENRYRCRDGSYRWLAWRAILAPGVPQQLVATARDITEQKLQAQRFRGIYEQAPLGIALIDSNSGRFLQVNPAYEQIIGRTEQEMVKLTIRDISYPDDLAEDLDNMALLIQGKIRQFQMEKRLFRGDNSVVWVSLTVVPMWQVGETPVCHLAMIDDITARKEAVERLRVREAQLSGILDHTSAVIYLKDSEGRYLLTNRRHASLFQHHGISILAKTDREFFPDAISETFQESDAKVWREQIPLDFEEVALHADGLHTYRSVKFPVRDETGKMIALGGISTDISDLKAALDSLQKEQDLLRNLIQVQENEKQVLCHEFHDGLIQYAAGSLMLLESCQNNPCSADNSSKVDTAIGNLRKGIEDGRRVIRGIRPAVLDNSGLEAAIDDLAGQFATSGIMVTSRCAPEIGRLPDSIQTTIYRVVQEALNNAKKYSGTDVVRIEVLKTNGNLHLEVRDFGCGFDLEIGRGRGFGLRGMMERVRLQGGECRIQSEPSAGTCISVRLPIPAAHQ